MSGTYVPHPSTNYLLYKNLTKELDDDYIELGGKSPNVSKKNLKKKSQISVCTTIISLLGILLIIVVLIWSYIHQ